MSEKNTQQQRTHCDFSCSEPMCQTLDRAGVPPDPKWRTLILYMRSLGDFDYLTEEQKRSIQELVVSTLKERDFTDQKFRQIMRRQEEILNSPCQQKLQSALAETMALVREFRETLLSRKGDVQKLQDTAIDTIGQGGDTDTMINHLRDAFHEVIEEMERDAANLTELSRTDALTGLHNRRALDEMLDQAVEKWLEDRTSRLSLVMIDIDHFKKFNDKYGHRIGDQALKWVARMLKEYAAEFKSEHPNRPEFFPTRYGGEEFAMVLPGMDKEQALDMAEALRQRFENNTFVIRGTDGKVLLKGIRITISLGVAQMDPDWGGVYAENLIDAADRALYVAKAQGRNRASAHKPSQRGECAEGVL